MPLQQAPTEEHETEHQQEVDRAERQFGRLAARHLLRIGDQARNMVAQREAFGQPPFHAAHKFLALARMPGPLCPPLALCLQVCAEVT